MRNGRTPDERLLPDRKATLAGDPLAGCAVFSDNGPPKCPKCGNNGPAPGTCWGEDFILATDSLKDYRTCLSLTYVELYNDGFRDLLAPSSQQREYE